MDVSSSAPPGTGIAFDNRDGRIYNSSGGAIVAGDILMLDFALSVATSLIPGGEVSAWGHGVQPTTAQLLTGTFCVALEAAANGALVDVRFQGVAHVNTASTPAALLGLVAANGVHTLAASAGSGREKIIAETVEAASGGQNLCKFDGVNGFGADAA